MPSNRGETTVFFIIIIYFILSFVLSFFIRYDGGEHVLRRRFNSCGSHSRRLSPVRRRVRRERVISVPFADTHRIREILFVLFLSPRSSRETRVLVGARDERTSKIPNFRRLHSSRQPRPSKTNKTVFVRHTAHASVVPVDSTRGFYALYF